MLAHEELDDAGVVTADAVVAAEASHLGRTELGMVAAAALGDVVEQRRDIEQPGLVPVQRELRAERVFVRVLGDEEAADVAQHHQDVLVDRVDVEQVVLHAPDDAPEDPQVAPEHRGLVHQPQRMGLAAVAVLQDLHEAAPVGRVAPERRVHQPARVVERAQRARRQALDAGRALVDVEGLQDGLRLAPVQPVVDHLEHAAAVEEARVGQRAHRRGLAAADALLDVEQQDLVELHDRLGGPVVAPHQQLGGALRRRRGQAQAVGHRRLQVEDQAVLAPPGDQVQVRADQPQLRLVALQLPDLERREQAVRGHLAPAPAQAGRARDPDQHLQVAQAAGALLAVGLEGVRRVLVLLLALAHLERLGAQEGVRVDRGVVRTAEVGVGAARTAHEA